MSLSICSVRDDTTNINALGDRRVELKRDVPVGVHAGNVERTLSPLTKFCWFPYLLKDFISDGVIIRASFGIRFSKRFVNELLSSGGNHLPISHERDVEEHISGIYECSRGAFKSCADVRPHGMRSCK